MRIKTGLLCLVLAGASWTDVCKGKVKNGWLAAGAAAGVWCRGTDFFPAAAVVLILTFLLYRMGAFGAGDGKLMSVMAGYLGIEAGTEAIFTGMVIGALWSLCRLWHNQSLKAYQMNQIAYFLQRIQTRKTKEYWKEARQDPLRTVPLAPCMAAGTYLYLMVSGMKAIGIK